jgi:hypothetical protein
MKTHPSTTQDGFSLLAALIAVGVVSTSAMVLMKMHANGMKSQQHTQIRTDLKAAKITVQNTISCQNTVGAIASTCNGIVPILNASGTPVQFAGKYALQATCIASNKGLQVQAAPLNPGAALTTTNIADFRTDPLTGQPLNWQNSALTLFKFPDGLCGSYFGSAAPPTGTCLSNNYTCVNTPGYQTVSANLAIIPDSGICNSPCSSCNWYHATGSASCPAGWRPVSSSVNCELTLNAPEGGGAGQGGGFLLEAAMGGDTSMFYDCCVVVSTGFALTQGEVPAAGVGGIFVGCVPDGT